MTEAPDRYIAIWRFAGCTKPSDKNSLTTRYSGQNSHLKPKMEIRPGLKGVLENLSNLGFRHYPFERFNGGLVDAALLESGLNVFFEKKAVTEFDPVGYYLNELGLTPEEARDRMIILGTTVDDKPIIPGPVFLQQATTSYDVFNQNAHIIEKIISQLKDLGEGDLGKGYDAMYTDAKPNDIRTCRYYDFLRGTEIVGRVSLRYETPKPDLLQWSPYLQESKSSEIVDTPVIFLPRLFPNGAA